MAFGHKWKSLLPAGESHLRKLRVKPQKRQSLLGQSFGFVARHKNAFMVQSLKETIDDRSSFCLRCAQAQMKYIPKKWTPYLEIGREESCKKNSGSSTRPGNTLQVEWVLCVADHFP